MTRTEVAFLLAFGLSCQVHAGRIAADAGYTNIGADEVKAIACHIEDTLRAVITGLRADGPHVTVDEMSQTMHLVAAAAVSTVLGPEPAGN